MAEEWIPQIDLDNASIPVTLTVVALSITATAVFSLFRKRNASSILSSLPNCENLSIMTQFSDQERQGIARGIASATTANDLFALFDNHQIFETLSLPTLAPGCMDDTQSLEQTFRDLVREKVIINDMCLEVDEEVRDNASKFRSYFESYISSTLHAFHPCISPLAVCRLCAHFSRTRAGGDSYFALQELFENSPFVITASPHHTHALTTISIDATSATVTITSNFDVYFAEQLHANDDLNDSEHLPEAIVTISAVTTEVVQLTSSSWSSLLLSGASPDITPMRRDLAISCFHPSSMWDVSYDRDVRSNSASSTPSTMTSTHATQASSARSASNSPADILSRSSSCTMYLMDTVDISTAAPVTPINTTLNLHKDSE